MENLYYIKDQSAQAIQGDYQRQYINLLNLDDQMIGLLFIPNEGYIGIGDGYIHTYERFIKSLSNGLVKHLSEYDALFEGYPTSVIDKGRVALSRLRYPLELEPAYQAAYQTFLRKYSHYILPFLIRAGDYESIRMIAEMEAIKNHHVQAHIDLARQHNSREILALLIDYQKRRWTKHPSAEISLKDVTCPDDWLTVENGDDTIVITKYNGHNLHVTIPTRIEKKRVRKLDGWTVSDVTLSAFFHQREVVQSVELEQGIVEIGARAFSGCSSLVSIDLPESVAKIGSQAFAGCTGLQKITLPRSLTEIGESAFWGCTKLETIDIPQSVKKIGKHAFAGCINLLNDEIQGFGAPSTKPSQDKLQTGKQISDIEKSDDILIRYNGNLEVPVLPEGIHKIAAEAFAGAKNLVSVIIPEGVVSIGDRAFLGCTHLKSISIPASVKVIGNEAFNRCHELSFISLRHGLTQIGERAFKACYQLNSLSIPESVEVIGKEAFSCCYKLSSISIPEGVREIAEKTFEHCSNLSSVTLPEGLIKISDEAFLVCSDLSHIKIPESVKEISGDAFFPTYKLIIHAPVGSFALEYAQENEIQYLEI